MITKLIHYYDTNLSMRAMVFRHFDKRAISLFASSVGLYLTMDLSLKREALASLTTVFFVFAGVFFIRREMTRFIERSYGLKIKGFRFNGPEFHEFKVNQLRNYLRRNNINTADQLRSLVETVHRRAERVKSSFLPGKSVWQAPGATLLGCFLGWIYGHSATWPEAARTTKLLTIIFAQFVGIVIIAGALWDEFWDRKKGRLRELSELLEDIDFAIPLSSHRHTSNLSTRRMGSTRIMPDFKA